MPLTSMPAQGMSSNVRYIWLFMSHSMKKLAVPGKLAMLVSVFTLNSKCQPGLVSHTPKHILALLQLRATSSSLQKLRGDLLLGFFFLLHAVHGST